MRPTTADDNVFDFETTLKPKSPLATDDGG